MPGGGAFPETPLVLIIHEKASQNSLDAVILTGVVDCGDSILLKAGQERPERRCSRGAAAALSSCSYDSIALPRSVCDNTRVECGQAGTWASVSGVFIGVPSQGCDGWLLG